MFNPLAPNINKADIQCAFKVPVHYKSETNYMQTNQSTLNSHHIRAPQAFKPDVKGLSQNFIKCHIPKASNYM